MKKRPIISGIFIFAILLLPLCAYVEHMLDSSKQTAAATGIMTVFGIAFLIRQLYLLQKDRAKINKIKVYAKMISALCAAGIFYMIYAYRFSCEPPDWTLIPFVIVLSAVLLPNIFSGYLDKKLRKLFSKNKE